MELVYALSEVIMESMMFEKLPPMPWTYETNSPVGKPPGLGNVYLVDANGRKIAVMYCSPEEKIALAEFICSDPNTPSPKRTGSDLRRKIFMLARDGRAEPDSVIRLA